MNSARASIQILSRAPVPGRTKTRLIPELGPQGAARVHETMLRMTVRTAAASQCGEVALWCAPDTEHPIFGQLRREHGVRLTAQPAGDLGHRMGTAIERGLHDGHPVIVVGTDCPELSVSDLRRAANALARPAQPADAVLGPAADGGYYLIGLRRFDPRLMQGLAWGTDTVLAGTREVLRALGWRWDELDEHTDVDRPEDLARFPALGAR